MPTEAARNGAACLSIMTQGTTAEGRAWVEQSRTTLGVMKHAASVALIATLYRLGATVVHVCKIEDDGDDAQTSNHVVVERPSDPPARSHLLALIEELAIREGLEGDPEDGQRYGLIWFDEVEGRFCLVSRDGHARPHMDIRWFDSVMTDPREEDDRSR